MTTAILRMYSNSAKHEPSERQSAVMKLSSTHNIRYVLLANLAINYGATGTKRVPIKANGVQGLGQLQYGLVPLYGLMHYSAIQRLRSTSIDNSTMNRRHSDL